MRLQVLIVLIGLAACSGNQQQGNAVIKADSTGASKAIPGRKDSAIQKDISADTSATAGKIKPLPKVYANERFKNVTVQKQGDHTFLVKGQGQIFEASFGWVVEDGHNELQKGLATTDAGAPEWGNFSFTVEAVKKRENSTLHLILFESSAKDGSRQYELPVWLE